MSYKRVLTIQDISCLGQCSLTVALPVLSACGLETCIIPSAVLSTHTGEFKGYTFRDLTDDFPGIIRHWVSQQVEFDGIYTGYLGNEKQTEFVRRIAETMLKPNGLLIVDPAMADNGKLYSGFGRSYVAAMKELCATADVILPNITEACLLTDTEYSCNYDEAYIDSLIEKLKQICSGVIALTGVSFDEHSTGIMVAADSGRHYYRHEKIPKMFHGTGDVYSSSFTAAMLNGKSPEEAAKIAADFTVSSIESTLDGPAHWYGVKFEKAIPGLIKDLGLS